MGLKSYNSADVQIIVGTRKLKGVAPDSFVTITFEEDAYTKQVGADGEVTRSKSNNQSGTIEVILQQTSEDNAFLQSLRNTDLNTNKGVVPVRVIDNSGSYLMQAAEAWIQKPADKEFARDSGTRSWTLAFAKGEETGGGN